jgi:hypothetical protein
VIRIVERDRLVAPGLHPGDLHRQLDRVGAAGRQQDLAVAAGPALPELLG